MRLRWQSSEANYLLQQSEPRGKAKPGPNNKAFVISNLQILIRYYCKDLSIYVLMFTF